MKKFIYNISFLFFLATMLVIEGCNPEDNEHWKVADVESGGSVRAVVDPNNAFFDVSNIETAKFAADLTAYDFNDGKDIASYDVYVSFVDASEGTSSDTVFVKSITQFPSRMEILTTEIATALGLESPTAFDAGDFFNFIMAVKMKDGRVFSHLNTSDDIKLENNSRGTFFLNTFVGCPTFDIASLVGTYDIIQDDWEVTLTSTTEVIAGPNSDQVTVKDVFGHGLDMVVTLDAAGIATVDPRQNTWVPQNFGLPAGYGKGYNLGNGRAFSCVGMMTFDFVYSVDIGTYPGTWKFAIAKQ